MASLPALPDDVLELGRELIPRLAFVVGCARSGTSILGEALAAHPGVEYLFELSPMWSELIEDREDHRLEAADAAPDLARGAYLALAGAAKGRAATGALVIEKNPKHVLRLGFLGVLFPWARFVHILRDGRDVTASLMFRNRGAEWGHLKVPGWRRLLEEYPRENHMRAAHQWRLAVEHARRDAEALEGRYLELRYESLVESPSAALAGVLAWLGLESSSETEAFCRKIQDETRGSYHARKQVRHYVENHARRIGRYRENLSPEQIAEVEAVCGDLLGELGYLEAAPGR